MTSLPGSWVAWDPDRTAPHGPSTLQARCYYLDGRSKIEIAGELGLSRFKVARLLDAARAAGLVCIEIAHPGAIDVELSTQLQAAFGLRHAVVVGTPDGNSTTLRCRKGLPAAADRTDCSLLSRPRGAQAGKHSAGERARRREDS